MKKEEKTGMTYAGVGVDYAKMDPFKIMAQDAAAGTAENIRRFGLQELSMCRGESAYLVEMPDCYIAHVEEGLGTKSLVADEMYRLTGEPSYGLVAQDAVAMIVNDMITLGALPFSIAMHLAVGDAAWFDDERRCRDLIDGWERACHHAGCAWGGGETPTLKDIVLPGAAVLSGSGVGIVRPKTRLIAGDVRAGDAIVFIESSGIHANGLTAARAIAAALPDGYLTKLPTGRTYGDTLLDPTTIYVKLVEACLRIGAEIHYAVNVTGHGWRKLMRLSEPFAYVIDKLPGAQPIFEFMQKHGPIDDREAYGNLNMGAGFALMLPEEDVGKVIAAAEMSPGIGKNRVVRVGRVEASDEKKVVIVPKGLTFTGSTLAVR